MNEITKDKDQYISFQIVLRKSKYLNNFRSFSKFPKTTNSQRIIQQPISVIIELLYVRVSI